MDRDPAGGLEQALARVVKKHVAVDLVTVLGAGAIVGETVYEQIGPVAVGAWPVALDEDVVADNRACSARGAKPRCRAADSDA